MSDNNPPPNDLPGAPSSEDPRCDAQELAQVAKLERRLAIATQALDYIADYYSEHEVEAWLDVQDTARKALAQIGGKDE